MASCSEEKQTKMGLWNFDLILELLPSLSKTVSTAIQENKSKNPSHQNNTWENILLQTLRGGTNLNGIRNDLIKKFNWSDFLIQLIGRRRVDKYTLHVIFLMHFAQFISYI